MDKFIKILRTVVVSFIIIWIVVWLSIRAFILKESGKVSFFNSFLIELHHAPSLVKSWYLKNYRKPFLAIEIDASNSLLEIGKGSDISGVNDSVYLLHSTFVNNTTSEVLMQNIKNGKVEMKWTIPLTLIKKDLDSIRGKLNKLSLKGFGPINIDLLMSKNSDEIGIYHPFFFKDSSLLFNVHHLGLTYKIDKYSKLLWKSKRLTHHSIEIDEEGNIWTCSIDLDNNTANKYRYVDDAILCLDKNGNEKYFKSLTDIFKENKVFKSLIEATPISEQNQVKDPYHLNEVQPVKSSGRFWNKGDVFLSLRHKSMVVLFRPKESKILWVMQGPWNMQHDINIVNDSIISMFNNNTSFLNKEINSSSNIAYYNFNNQTVNFEAKDIFSSETQGRQSKLTTGDFFIESTDSGIYYLLDSIGTIKYNFYVPYPPQPEFAQVPGWSRVYIRENNTFIEQ